MHTGEKSNIGNQKTLRRGLSVCQFIAKHTNNLPSTESTIPKFRLKLEDLKS